MQKALVFMFALILLFGSLAIAHDGYFVIEGGTAITMGKFSYLDYTVDISKEFFNPRLSLEYVFPDSDMSIGFLFSNTKNSFDLEYDDGKKNIDGTLDVKRTEILPFFRLGPHDRHSLRLGFRMFNYKFSDGAWLEYRDGSLTKNAIDGKAEGKLSTGLDAELNLNFGNEFKFNLMLGASYFFNAKYNWEYYDLLAGRRETGDAKLNALSIRFSPGLSFQVMDNMRISANYIIEATSWLGSKDDEHEEYAGVDIVSAILLKVKYVFDL